MKNIKKSDHERIKILYNRNALINCERIYRLYNLLYKLSRQL